MSITNHWLIEIYHPSCIAHESRVMKENGDYYSYICFVFMNLIIKKRTRICDGPHIRTGQETGLSFPKRGKTKNVWGKMLSQASFHT